MEQATEQAAAPTIPPRKYKGTSEKEQAIRLLEAEGMETREIANALGIKEKTIYNIRYKLRKEGERNPLLASKRIKNAVKCVDSLMRGEPFGTIEKVKDSTALAASQVVLDRAYPKQDDKPTNSYTFTKVDLTVYQTQPKELKE